MQSLKKYLSQYYYSMPLTDSLKYNKLIVITPSGVIMGSPISNDEMSNDANLLATLSLNCVKEYREKNSLEPSQQLDGNDGFITLKNVTLQTGEATFNFAVLNVFYDQIVAITVGNPE